MPLYKIGRDIPTKTPKDLPKKAFFRCEKRVKCDMIGRTTY